MSPKKRIGKEASLHALKICQFKTTTEWSTDQVTHWGYLKTLFSKRALFLVSCNPSCNALVDFLLLNTQVTGYQAKAPKGHSEGHISSEVHMTLNPCLGLSLEKIRVIWEVHGWESRAVGPILGEAAGESGADTEEEWGGWYTALFAVELINCWYTANLHGCTQAKSFGYNLEIS